MSDKIRQMRVKNNLTQDELAEKLGVSGALIGYWEKDESKLTIEKLQKIAKAVGCKVWELLPDEDQPEPDDSKEKYNEAMLAVKKLLDITVADKMPEKQNDIQKDTEVKEAPRTKDGRRKYRITPYRATRKHG